MKKSFVSILVFMLALQAIGCKKEVVAETSSANTEVKGDRYPIPSYTTFIENPSTGYHSISAIENALDSPSNPFESSFSHDKEYITERDLEKALQRVATFINLHYFWHDEPLAVNAVYILLDGNRPMGGDDFLDGLEEVERGSYYFSNIKVLSNYDGFIRFIISQYTLDFKERGIYGGKTIMIELSPVEYGGLGHYILSENPDDDEQGQQQISQENLWEEVFVDKLGSLMKLYNIVIEDGER